LIEVVLCRLGLSPTARAFRRVLGLGRGLGLPVLAEGVETSAELQFLKDEMCDEVQGYLLGRPAAIDSFRCYTHGEAVDADVRNLRLAAKSREPPADWPSSIVSWVSKWLRVRSSEVPAKGTKATCGCNQRTSL
jgi:hypothetical protein